MNSRLLSVQFFISFLVLSFGVNAMDSLDDMGSRLTSKKRGLSQYKKELLGDHSLPLHSAIQISLMNAVQSGKGVEYYKEGYIELDNVLGSDVGDLHLVTLGYLKNQFNILRDKAVATEDSVREEFSGYEEVKPIVDAIQPFLHAKVRLGFDFVRLNDFIKQKDLDADENRLGGTPHAQLLFQSIRTNRSNLINAIDKAEDARAIVEAFKKPLALTWQQKVQLRWLKFRSSR